MKIVMDLAIVEKLLMRHCGTALEAFGFDLGNDGPPITVTFAYDDESNATGLEINQAPATSAE
jgi:hypothetical protein